jgi:tetratricopeptide (TPR) repeat protein
MKKPYFKTVTVLVTMAAFLLPLFFSCSSHSEGSSFVAQLDEIDMYINGSDTKEALSLLEKASKKASSAFARLGIYKRYMILGETELAEKTLVKGLKKIPNNNELAAVYTQFLLRAGRIDEALERSRSLADSDYSSLYAEAVFRAAQQRGSDAASVFKAQKKYKAPKKDKDEEQKTNAKPENFFMDERLIPVYADAWKSSKQTRWLRNAATLCMQKGAYNDAVLLVPPEIITGEDSLFWGIIYYDSGKYGESLSVLQNAPTTGNVGSFPQQIAALEADDYYILGDEEASQKQRDVLLASADPLIEQYRAQNKNPLQPMYLDEGLASVIPVVLINDVRYAHLSGDVITEFNTLVRLVDVFPQFEPGLASYGQFALNTYRRPPEDELLREIRKAGIRTEITIENDAVPKIAVQIALEKINAALKLHKSPSLIVLREKIKDALDSTSTDSQRLSHLWTLLENNELGTDLYPPEIVRYVVSRMISLDDVDDAHTVFDKFLQAEYGTEDSVFIAAEKPQALSLWECQFAAWFAADANNVVDSRRLYEYVIDSYSGRTPLINSMGDNNAIVEAYINLGVIYSSTSQYTKALDMLNNASARTTDPVEKAEVLYRMAVISSGQGDDRSAIRSLQYALSLDPTLDKARLMLKRLQ